MNRISSRKYLPVLATVVLAVIVMSIAVNAQAQDVFSTLQNKTTTAYTNVRNLGFLIGGFGVIGLGVMAYFGRFQFKWMFSLVGGMVLMAVTGAAIQFLTTNTTSSTTSAPTAQSYSDTMTTQ